MNKGSLNRREFQVGALATGGLTGLLSQLPKISAKETRITADVVRFGNGIEPTVRFIEDTPRGKLIDLLVIKIKNGLSYRELLAALLLAGIRNVQPRPSVGFKFHCVLVVNSCHLASMSAPDEDRWLPLLWAADYFKSSQADEAARSGWKMQSVNESLVPQASAARKMFEDAMENWDVEKADAATAGICRSLGATDVFNLFAKYAARDYRSIGHKAIYLANTWRTLQVIGWNYAEPVMRSLAFALLNHNGEPNPAQSDLAADQPWRKNQEFIGEIPTGWLSGKPDESIPHELIRVFRSGKPDESSKLAVESLVKGVSPRSIWDGVFLGAGELLMRQPGIIGLHGLTTANAMHFLWKTAADPELRKQLLLQACSFNPMFRESALGRGKLADRSLEKLSDAGSGKKGSMEKILSLISSNPMDAAVELRSHLEQGGNAHQFVNESRKLLFRKGRDAHDYKFSSAVLEDYAHVSPRWRDEFLAMSVFNLKGSGHADNSLYKRIQKSN